MTMGGHGAPHPPVAFAPAAPAASTIRLRLPFAPPLVQKMMAVYIVLLFVVSANVLDLIGYDYSAIGGSPITKIHVSTYFIVLLFAVFLITYPQKGDLARYYLATRLGTIFFFCAATFAVINIVVDGRNGFGMYFDTDLHLFLCAMLLPFVTPDNMDRLERFLHWFFLVNAVLAVVELAIGFNIFPLITYSPDGMTTVEPRATAFLSHPLHAATITCVYIVSLLCGAGKALRPNLRMPMILLQCAALLAFGGRTAFLLTGLIMAGMLLWGMFRVAAGMKVSQRGLIVLFSIIPVGIAAIAVLAAIGAFDPLLDRFTEDGGSARTRWLMVPLLLSFDWGDLLWGAHTDYVRSQVYSYGLEWGVENPFIQMSVFQGVIVASLIMLGILLLMWEAYRRMTAKAVFPIAVFFFLCSTFGSFAGRFFTFAIFLIVVATLFRRPDAPPNYVS
ncbi:VpsF family polysaccharide biosynthesis protein [Rhodopseudomonas palustris]|uniref:VpsF family polysaccharide biosynthesis protein n=1 Tax=Rhodopseudomonas palustris TaxID=1076 RepID=UPI002ACE3F2D|nr:VpsF family polysaccharide biosynthesis protein [Rhodopseudomonas palustris]WQG98098.1 VpsF family polysaccharide biosynthesis protein [Rhodopseudomonas palustris]